MTINWLLPVTGFVVGLLVGLTGMGGGVLMTPMLMLGFGLPPSAAVSTDLTYAAFTKMVGGWQHWRQGTVDLRLVRDLAIGSLPASILAVQVLVWLRGQNSELTEFWLGRLIGLTLLVAAALMLKKVLARPVPDAPERVMSGRSRAIVIAIGALGGFLAGMTSVGSGSVIMALLVLLIPISAEKLVGTDIVHGALLVGMAALAHYFVSEIDMALVAMLLVGSIPGVLLGSRLAVKAPRRALQLLLALVLAISAVLLLLR